MDRYKILAHMNAGAHGVILKGTYANVLDKSSVGEIPEKYLLAIKRIFIRNKAIPLTIVREIKCLQFLRSHHNIIPLEDVFALGSSVNLVFPLLPINMTTIIYEMAITDDQRRQYVRMLLEGLRHCHTNGIIHRDLKPSNLLIDWDGMLKICDFGQARALSTSSRQLMATEENENPIDENPVLSHQVCTRWYRCPELLYGSNSYNNSVDIWSVGCIVGELLQKWPLFKGESDIEQLCLVVTALGTPPEEWVNELPDFNKIQFNRQTNSEIASKLWLKKLKNKYQSEMGWDLVSKLCRYTERLDTDQALRHPYAANCPINESLLIKPNFIHHLVGPPKKRHQNHRSNAV